MNTVMKLQVPLNAGEFLTILKNSGYIETVFSIMLLGI